MSSTIITNDGHTENIVRSGSTYTSDPTLDTVATPQHPANEFLKVRDIRPVVTTGFAVLGAGLLVLALTFLIGNSFLTAASMLAIGAVGASLAAVVIGARRSRTYWAYQLAGYISIAAAVTAVLTTASIYFSTLFEV